MSNKAEAGNLENKKLLKTNIMISIILVIGFTLTAILSYKANYQASIDNIEQVSSLTAEGIYYQMTTIFTKPVNISLTMAHDSLLYEHLSNEAEHLDDKEYIETIKTYLKNYQSRYGFDSVFLVSSATGRYYNFNGLDRILSKDNSVDDWYYHLMNSDQEYKLNVDTDKVSNAHNEITVFVDCKIQDPDGTVMGVVGVGIRIDYLKELLKGYEEKYNIEASLINTDGIIEISTTHTGYENLDWFEIYHQEEIRQQVLNWKQDSKNLEIWSASQPRNLESNFVVARYIPELSWNLIVEKNTGKIIWEMKKQVSITIGIIIGVILLVLVIITKVIRKFNKQVTELIEERQAIFKKATERLYDNIYEFNITNNSCVGERTEEYFESIGAKGFPYDQGLQIIARKQIKEEFREGYLTLFHSKNIKEQYDSGKEHLQYDFMFTQNGTDYHWMRIDAYIFYSNEDQSLYMFAYHKNIDAEKKRELQATTDEMTGFLTKKATERFIERRLLENSNRLYAFIIFDIDNFKEANDNFGHSFGDDCIRKFTRAIRSCFDEHVILGRIGGDEFVAFLSISNIEKAEKKAKELTEWLQIIYTNDQGSWGMSASIGISIAPQNGTDFKTLYQKADAALYKTKQNGKKGYTIYQEDMI